MTPAVDLRLFPASAAAWVAGLLVVRLPATWSWGGAAVCVAAWAVLMSRRRGSGRRLGPVRRHVPGGPGAGGRGRRRLSCGDAAIAPAAGVVLVVLAAVLGAGGVQRAVRAAGPLAQLAAERAQVTVRGALVGGPQTLSPGWPGAPVRVRVELADVTVAVGRVDLGGGADAPDEAASGTEGVPVAGAARSAGRVVVLGPQGWASVPHGARVAVAGVLDQGRAGQRAVGVLVTDADPAQVRAPPPGHRLAAVVRAEVVRQSAGLSGDAGALLPGLAVGDTVAVPDGLHDALRTAGLTHLTAVSGGHFSLVAGLVLALATAVRLPRGWRAALVSAAMCALVVLVHPEPSVVRAAAMGTVGVLGLLLGRPARAPAALATAVIVLLVVDPWLAGELGFVLSVLATAGLVTLGVPLAERWSGRCGRPVALALALPVAAQLACAPAVLLVRPAVALYAAPANLLVAPVVGPATVLGLGAGVVGTWWPAVGHLLALGAGAACWWVGAVARVVAALPGAEVSWLPGPAGGVALAVTCVSTARLLVWRRPERRVR